MSRQLNLRAHAAKLLVGVVKNKRSLGRLFPYQAATLSPKDEALLQELCFGVCRWYERLSAEANELLDKPLKAKDNDVNVLLLLGLYQLQFTRIPSHAAISETVQACKQLKKVSASRLINAVLRRYEREQSQILACLCKKTNYLYSHPNWLVQRLKEAWPKHWEGICVANNERGPMTLRVNPLRHDRADYLAEITSAGVIAAAGLFSPSAVVLNKPVPVENLLGFNKGECSIQDEAAQLAAGLLMLEPDQHVLDACAAPGGKTGHLLETEPNLASLTALEQNRERAKKIDQNLQRLNFATKVKVIEGDARQPQQWWDQQVYDRILLDAPCSATGVIRRHPDIKLLRSDEDISVLAALQLEMLEALWPLLKPRGILLYATCSVLPDENEQVISRFMKTHDNANALRIDANWGIAQTFGRQLFPQPQGHDGFYYACLQKHE